MSAHYHELTWILIWFHFVPQVGKGPEIPAHDFGVKVRLAQRNLGEALVVFVLAQKLTLPKPSQQIQRSNLLQSDSDWGK